MYEEYLEHFPEDFSEEIKNYAIEYPLKFSRYIFTSRKGKQQYGYCTHCKKEFRTNKLRHNAMTQCPYCKSECKIKSSGLGRKYMVDEVYFTYYEKSLVNPNVIIARGIYARKNYSNDYMNAELKLWTDTLYVFEMGNSAMLIPTAYRQDRYEKRVNINSRFGYWASKSYIEDVTYSRESIQKAVQGTPFQHSTWENYHCNDMVRFFDLYSNYPLIEYLTKEGFDSLVKAKLNNACTYGAVYWRAKTIYKMLRLNKVQLRELKKSKVKVSTLMLRLCQLSIKSKSNLSFEYIESISNSYGVHIEDVQKILKYTSLRKIDNYINKQRTKYPKNFNSHTSVLTSWKDYIADCIKLEMDLGRENVLFPKDLHTAHQNTIKQVVAKANVLQDKKLKKRVESLEKYCFEYDGLIIRPAKTTMELIEESKALDHCVAANYSERYANGKTNIFFIRKAETPDIPYFTVEIKKDEVVQVRGKRNCSPREDVNSFIKIFKSEKLDKKKIDNRVRVSMSA